MDFSRTSKGLSNSFQGLNVNENTDQHFYTGLGLYQQCQVLQKIVEFRDFSRPLSDFPVLFKADLIF